MARRGSEQPRRRREPLPDLFKFRFETTMKQVEKSERELNKLQAYLKSEKHQPKRDHIRQLILEELEGLLRRYNRAIDVANNARGYELPSIKFADYLQQVDRSYEAKIKNVEAEIRKIYRKVREN